MDVADVLVDARLGRCRERLGLVVGDVARVEPARARCRQRVSGRVLVGDADRGSGLDRQGHGAEHEIRDGDRRPS